MRRIFGWLEDHLPRFKSLDLPDALGESESVKPDEVDLGVDLPDELRDLVNDVQIPDGYAEDYDDTVPNLAILDLSPPDTDESTGFNPYDTGTLQIK